MGVNGRVGDRVQNTAQTGKSRANGERERDDLVNIDTHQAGGRFIKGNRAHGNSHFRAFHQELQEDLHQDGNKHDNKEDV